MSEMSQHRRRPRGSEVDALTGPEVKALAALLEHGGIPEAAAAIGMAERTLRRWAAKPAFRRALLTERQRMLDGAISKLASYSGEAADCLAAVMNDPQAAPSARVAAARVVLEQARGTVLESALKDELESIEALKEGRRLAREAEASVVQ